MELVKNSDITLTVDGNGVPIFFEPVRSQQTVRCIEGHKRNDLWTFEVLLTNFFWATFDPEEIGEKHLKRSKVTVFVAVNAKHSLLGPYWRK